MTYVVTENCIKCKYTDCVEVCPVDCFHEGPNFLVIVSDDQRPDTIHALGNPIIQTPNLDKMAAEGMRFTSFYSVCSVCSPTRRATSSPSGA